MQSKLFVTLNTTQGKQLVVNKKYIVSAVEKNIGQLEVRTTVGDTFVVTHPFMSLWDEINQIEHTQP